MRGVFAWLGNTLVGWRPGRPPIAGPHDLHRYLDDLAKRAGGKLEFLVPAQLAEGAKRVTVGAFVAREERRTRRKRGRVARLERRVGSFPADLMPTNSRFFDPLVARVWIYVLSFGLFVTVLESTGTYATLGVFDGVLGEFRLPLAIAAGVILFLSGHACGHLLFGAVKARSLTRSVLLVCVTAIVVVAAVAICWTAIDRSSNERAQAKGVQAGAISDAAGKLEDTAKRLEAPQPKATAEVELPSRSDRKRASKLRREAAELRKRATAVEREEFEGRSLNFLAGIQLVGLVVGISGGWLFSEATPLRVGRMRSRADRLRARINSIVEDEAGAAGAAHGHFQAELAIQGVDVSAEGLPDFELVRHLLEERSAPEPSENGRVEKQVFKGGR